MRNGIVAGLVLVALSLTARAQIDQQAYWRQVDEQMRQQEQQRWANEMIEQSWYHSEAAQESWNEPQPSYSPEPSYAPPDPMSVWLRQAGAMAGVGRDLLMDPQYERVREGFWDFHAVNGEYRSAMFSNLDGVISVHGPGGGYDGALLMLWGPKIPAPKTLTQIPVTLQQNQDPPQTVTTLNLGFPSVSGWGTLIFVVPSSQALLDNMMDDQSFTATIDGQVVFSSSWHDGKAARARLSDG